MKLNELQPKEGSKKERMRVGRGIGSGKGKTCGVGQKGQKSRSGVAIKGFEGGQMPLYQRLPKRGFKNNFGNDFTTVSLGRLQTAIDNKMIDPKKQVDEDMLVAAKVVRRKKDGVRLIGGGELKTKLDLKLSGGASKPAQAALEKAGGKLELIVVERAWIKNSKEEKKAKEAK
jgi:large subunit ribosomal protein L15